MKRQAVRRTSAITVALASLASVAARAADLQALNQATQAARSASGASAVVTGSAVPSLGFGAVLQTVFGLVLVIAVVFACGWLARRLGLQHGPKNALIKTVGGASLGGKERVAVVEIGDTWLVLGASPGSVTLLHTMPAGELPNAAGASANGPALQGSFGQRFRDALKHEAGKRFKRHDGGAQ
ncbi:flagellar protein FliO/FliZ [Paraburkholderia bannensis]|uniref:Flagellar protein n=1 Tax=Paraburkholderia bannensis TaxID=765414 RepID=A0A7W9TUA8_9BURK|nr:MULTISPECIES: flagellar biosynthetic protein FliO [Paraburkholderia]MBB3255821.1 flagellar protein FliO/FliZ [Paraburkholderia sp. WP4_3_2]MBB6100821.1 flagellar protein FliO/FliZ [Paraburkholderia bannensis]